MFNFGGKVQSYRQLIDTAHDKIKRKQNFDVIEMAGTRPGDPAYSAPMAIPFKLLHRWVK